jgi:uncharacterized protein (TIGR03067 family)
MFFMVICVSLSNVVVWATSFADLPKLEGRWRVVSFRDSEPTATVTFNSGEIVYELPYAKIRLGKIVRLNANTKPKQMNLQREDEVFPGLLPDQTWLAIYELKGDTLRICINRPGTRRPTDFPSKVSEADHGAEWFVLKREKK